MCEIRIIVFIVLYWLIKKIYFYKFGCLKCFSFDELVFDSYEWWVSCIKVMRDLIVGLKLSLNKLLIKYIMVL